MKVKTLIILVLLIVIMAAAVYFGWKFLLKPKTPEEKAADAVQKSVESAAAGVLPEIAPVSNPLEKLPEINPVEKTNPFKGLKVNPFE
jgi:Flp pilus assembly protein CpaB